MLSSIRELEPCHVAKGALMRVFEDESKPPDSMERRWTVTTWDGKTEELFYVPKHWHEFHDEHTEILEGKLNIFINDKWHVVTPETGKVVIPRGIVHGFLGEKGTKMTLKEFVYPGGDYKVAFFRDLTQQGPPGFWMAIRSFYDYDTYPSLGGYSKTLDRIFITVLGAIAKLFKPAPLTVLKIPK